MFNSLEKSLYCLYDKKLQIYKNVFCATGVEAKHIFTELANDVTSEFYSRCSDFDCYFLTSFNCETGSLGIRDDGSIDCVRFIICPLDTLVDKKRIELQYMIQTLNYLPVGYFKMPSEMQQDIKDKIDEQVKKYASYLSDNITLDKEENVKVSDVVDNRN